MSPKFIQYNNRLYNTITNNNNHIWLNSYVWSWPMCWRKNIYKGKKTLTKRIPKIKKSTKFQKSKVNLCLFF